MVIKKCREIDEDILFIDASNEFEKQGSKNRLLEEHIDKITNCYNSREQIDKFSYRAKLEEIKENDYNLNIPRYVDTFEEEEPVDIDAVMKEIKNLETERAELDKEIEGYFQELGLAF